MSKKLEVVEFKAADLDSLNLWMIDDTRKSNEDLGFILEHAGPAYTIGCEDGLVACAGMTMIFERVGEIWCISDKRSKEHSWELLHLLRQLLEQHIQAQKLYRVQAHVQANWAGANRFMIRLGLEPEAVLKWYGPNREDYILYARLEPWEESQQDSESSVVSLESALK